MGHSSWEADEEYIRILWKRMFHYDIHSISLATDSCPEPYTLNPHTFKI
jgi:hypothetical protein